MAQDLSLATRIGTNSDYLNGNIEIGTLVGPHINQDIVQFFQKLMASAGLTPNDLDDNEVNGYQFIDALVSKIRENTIQDRGDIADYDFKGTDLDDSAGFHDLPLGSIIPVGAKFALLNVNVISGITVGDSIQITFRAKGNTYLYNSMSARGRCVVSSYGGYSSSQILIPLDVNRKIEYILISDTTVTDLSVDVTVAGWSF